MCLILPFFIGLAATTLMRNPPWGCRRTDLKRQVGTISRIPCNYWKVGMVETILRTFPPCNIWKAGMVETILRI